MRGSRLLAGLGAASLLLVACGGVNDAGTSPEATAADGTEAEAPADGEGGGNSVTVAGFNFSESSILLEIYAQALEGAGVTVERQADAGTRELLLPEVRAGNIDIVPEYLGSLLSAGYGETPDTDPQAALEQAREVVAADDLALLEPAEAQNKNVFVVATDWAESNGVTSLADLADAGDVTLAGGPECEARETCFAGLSSVYGLDNVSFESVQEKGPRLTRLESGDVEMILLFSTDPVFEDGTLTILEDPENLTPPESVVPLVRQDALDADPAIEETLDAVSAALTTEGLTTLNAEASQGSQPADIAAGWLEDNGMAG